MAGASLLTLLDDIATLMLPAFINVDWAAFRGSGAQRNVGTGPIQGDGEKNRLWRGLLFGLV